MVLAGLKGGIVQKKNCIGNNSCNPFFSLKNANFITSIRTELLSAILKIS